MNESASDRLMVEAVLTGAPGAGRAFITYHDGFVRKTVRRASPGAAPLVDDLTHDVYIHLWRHDFRVLRQWQHDHPLRAYIGTVARRLVWQKLRRLQPEWEVVDEDPFSVAGSEPSGLAPSPEDEVAAEQVRCIVRDALSRLDPKQSLVLELRFARELSYDEIGAALGITGNNAGVRINRALARLKTGFPHLLDCADDMALSAA